MYAGYFARKYPDSVTGMLMVDPVPSNYQYSNRIQKQFKIALAKWTKSLAGRRISYTVSRDQIKIIR